MSKVRWFFLLIMVGIYCVCFTPEFKTHINQNTPCHNSAEFVAIRQNSNYYNAMFFLCISTLVIAFMAKLLSGQKIAEALIANSLAVLLVNLALFLKIISLSGTRLKISIIQATIFLIVGYIFLEILKKIFRLNSISRWYFFYSYIITFIILSALPYILQWAVNAFLT